MFRDQLLKTFVTCYDPVNFKQLGEDFREFKTFNFEEVGINLKNFIVEGHFDCEKFWIFLYSSTETYQFKLLARFFINLLTIPHANMFVERMFNQVNLIKTKTKSLLEVSSVSAILQIKSYFPNDEELFEPEEIHYSLYEQFVKNIKYN